MNLTTFMACNFPGQLSYGSLQGKYHFHHQAQPRTWSALVLRCSYNQCLKSDNLPAPRKDWCDGSCSCSGLDTRDLGRLTVQASICRDQPWADDRLSRKSLDASYTPNTISECSPHPAGKKGLATEWSVSADQTHQIRGRLIAVDRIRWP